MKVAMKRTPHLITVYSVIGFAILAASQAVALSQPGESRQKTLPSIAGKLEARGISIQIDGRGEIVSAAPVEFSERIRLGNLRADENTTLEKRSDGGYTITRRYSETQKHTATLLQRFIPEKDSIRWELEITSPDPFWTVPITTEVDYARAGEKQIWAAWGATDSDVRIISKELSEKVMNGKAAIGGRWVDPLVPARFTNRNWRYGIMGLVSDFICLPLFSVFDPASDAGVSLVLSPEDVLLNLDFAVTATGQLRCTRTQYRLGNNHPVKFTMHLAPHEASWRGGLRFLTARYPRYFDPPNPRVHQIAGCGAYSSGEERIDVAKFKQMALGFNWKLSDDFPYMGMFIPPVKDADERWQRSCDEKTAAYKSPTTSCQEMNRYARYMKENGFSVLSYFNVAEYGKNMYGRKPLLPPDDPQLWKDPAAYLANTFPNAVWNPGLHTCYNAYIVDVGDPAYQKFILEQAARNIRLLPDTDGLCIDRADWLWQYNSKADDGISWVKDSPVRSLFLSWAALMEKLGPQMHQADKVIFCNLYPARLELCRELDGLYSEHGHMGLMFNATALLCLRKPAAVWSYNATLNQPDPDSYMQRHLYMGVFPTAPYPANNHCITPEPRADQLYLDYGPLLNAMRGRKWFLAPHCVESRTPGVKVNLFEASAAYLVPVTFGGESKTAIVRLRGIPAMDQLKAEAIHPGIPKPVAISTGVKDGVMELSVPLVRGCAMVRLALP